MGKKSRRPNRSKQTNTTPASASAARAALLDDQALETNESRSRSNGEVTSNIWTGGVYEGEYKNDKMNGKGKFTYGTGDVYDGEWKDDKRNGNGIYTYASGDLYVGEFENGKLNGYGKFTSVSGAVYEGEFKDGKMTGKGKNTSVQQTFDTLFQAEDWEGALYLESQLTEEFENSHPSEACAMCYRLGFAHKQLAREGSMEQAIIYYTKAVEFAKKGTDSKKLFITTMYDLAKCYIQTGRSEKAMDLHKSICDDIGKEMIDPNHILMFNQLLQDNSENSRALEILEEHVGVIESCWDKSMQGPAYAMLAELNEANNDWIKSFVYYERQLSIAKEINDLKLEAKALNGLGSTYGKLGEFRIAVGYLEQQLVIVSEMGDSVAEARAHFTMGDVLLAQGGHEKEAIEMLQKARGISQTSNDQQSLSWTLCKLGEALRAVEAWDDSIAALENSISIAESIEVEVEDKSNCKIKANQVLGQTYLEQYYNDESLVDVPEKRDEVMEQRANILRQALCCSEKAVKCGLSVLLDMAQEHYFLGGTDNAHVMLKRYLDATVQQVGPSHCQACHQICAKDAIMDKCSVCKVARYCSEAHNMQAWMKGRLCHKVMCPFLTRWRKAGKDNVESSNAILNDFFDSLDVAYTNGRESRVSSLASSVIH